MPSERAVELAIIIGLWVDIPMDRVWGDQTVAHLIDDAVGPLVEYLADSQYELFDDSCRAYYCGYCSQYVFHGHNEDCDKAKLLAEWAKGDPV